MLIFFFLRVDFIFVVLSKHSLCAKIAKGFHLHNVTTLLRGYVSILELSIDLYLCLIMFAHSHHMLFLNCLMLKKFLYKK